MRKKLDTRFPAVSARFLSFLFRVSFGLKCRPVGVAGGEKAIFLGYFYR